MKTVSLEMTPDQASVNVKALDLYSRVLIGQFNIVAELFRHDYLVVRDPNSAKGKPLTVEDMERAELLCNELKRIIGFEPGASFGIGNQAVHKDAHRSYEVLCVLRQALAFDSSPEGKSVHHYGLGVRYTDDPAPKATITEDVNAATARDVLGTWARKHGVSFVSRSAGEYSTGTISRDALLALARETAASAASAGG